MSTADLAREHLTERDEGVLAESQREESEQGFVSTVLAYMSRQMDESTTNAPSIIVDDDDIAENDAMTIMDTRMPDNTLNVSEDVLASGALAVTSAILSVLARNNPMEARAFCVRNSVAHRRYGGATLLTFSAQRGNTAAVQVLLDARADVEMRHRDWTAVMYASGHGHAATTAALVAAAADVNARTAEGVTALMHAAARGHVEAVGVLLGADADVDARDVRGRTALMTAAAHGHVAVVTRLLSARAVVGERDNTGSCALVLAAQRGYANVVAALVCAGACGRSRSGMGTCAGVRGGGGACGGMRDGAGRDALGWAAAGGYVQCVRVLLAAGAEVDIGEVGCTALMLAVLRRGAREDGEERERIREREDRRSQRESLDEDRGNNDREGVQVDGERSDDERDEMEGDRRRDREDRDGERGRERDGEERDGEIVPVVDGGNIVRGERDREGRGSGRVRGGMRREGNGSNMDEQEVNGEEGRGGRCVVGVEEAEPNAGREQICVCAGRERSRVGVERDKDIEVREPWAEDWAECVRLLLEAAARDVSGTSVSRRRAGGAVGCDTAAGVRRIGVFTSDIGVIERDTHGTGIGTDTPVATISTSAHVDTETGVRTGDTTTRDAMTRDTTTRDVMTRDARIVDVTATDAGMCGSSTNALVAAVPMATGEAEPRWEAWRSVCGGGGADMSVPVQETRKRKRLLSDVE